MLALHSVGRTLLNLEQIVNHMVEEESYLHWVKPESLYIDLPLTFFMALLTSWLPDS
jgi:hypothetical protein